MGELSPLASLLALWHFQCQTGDAGANDTFPDILLVMSTRTPPSLLLFMLNSLWCFERRVCIQMPGKRKDKAKSFQFYSINTLLNELFSRNLLQLSWRLSQVLDFSTHVCVKYTHLMDQICCFCIRMSNKLLIVVLIACICPRHVHLCASFRGLSLSLWPVFTNFEGSLTGTKSHKGQKVEAFCV